MSGATTKLTAKSNNSTNGAASLSHMHPTLNNGLAVTEPSGAYFNSYGTVVDANGYTISSRNVVISKPTTPQYSLGDINGDGKVDVSDVNIVINIMLGKANASQYPGNPDVNNDNKVDVSDVNKIINIMLGKG